MSFSAVIAAAGLSSRMHEFKPMVCLGKDTFILGVIHTLQEAGVQDIVVVAGYRADTLKKHLEGTGVILCENRDYASTKMYDSFRLGLKALPRPADGFFLMPGDVPLVRSDTVRVMASSGATVARPVFEGTVGHPTYFAAPCLEPLLAYSGENGLRGAILALGFPVTDIPVDDRGVILDADTREDLKTLRRQELKNRNPGALWMDLDLHIGRGDTDITPEGIQLLEMIGETGSIQSACGCMHMSYTKGWRLLNAMEKGLGIPLTERVTGGSEGGCTRLSDAGTRLVERYNLFRSELKQAAEMRFKELFLRDGI